MRRMTTLAIVLMWVSTAMPAAMQTGCFELDGPMPASNPAQLFSRSPAIVEATVQSLFPATEMPFGTRTRLHTDVLLHVDQTIKGSGIGQEIVVSQMGGTLAERKDRPCAYSMMQPGERYIVPLVPSSGNTAPPRLGVSRYEISGSFFGLLHLNGNSLGFSAGVPAAWRDTFAGMDAAQIVAAVKSSIGVK